MIDTQKSPNNSSTPANPVGRFMVAAGAVVELEGTGTILLVQRAADLDWHPGEWEIVYGRIDQFEDTEQGLRRELHEEVGLVDVTIKRVLRVWHIFRGQKSAENELIGITYHCTTRQSEIVLSDEHAAYAWVTPQEAQKLISVDGIQKDVEMFIEASR